MGESFEEDYFDSQRRAAKFNEEGEKSEEQLQKEAEEKRLLEEEESLKKAELLKAGLEKEKTPDEQDSGAAVFRGVDREPEDVEKTKTSKVDELVVESVEGFTDKKPLDDDISGAGEK